MKNNILLLFTIIATTLGLSSCAKDENNHNTTDIHEKTNRTVLAYMIGDINLWFHIEESINLMEKGWNDDIDGKLLVYLDNSKHLTQFGQPVLLEITHDESDAIVSKVVKTYNDQDAGNPNVMESVLNDAITLYPADSHGLIIGSHSNGWMPDISEYNKSRSISGPDRYGSNLQINKMAEILPLKYDFIVFHGCDMSNIESAYQLRNKCDYIMASAAGLPAYGYSYDLIIPYLFTKPYADLHKTSYISANHYSKNIDKNNFNNLTIEVIKTSELSKLAIATSRLIDDLNMSYQTMMNELYREREELNDIPNSNYIICYNGGYLIDLKGLYFLSNNETLKDNFDNALNNVVIQNYAVGGIDPEQIAHKLNLSIDHNNPRSNLGIGLSFYLPYYDKEYHDYWTQFNSIYCNDYDWAKASGFDKKR